MMVMVVVVVVVHWVDMAVVAVVVRRIFLPSGGLKCSLAAALACVYRLPARMHPPPDWASQTGARPG